jgi:hypothetical protein
MTLSSHDARLSWTQLGVHMGYTAEETQREEILDAIERMTWTEPTAHPPYLDGPAVGAIVNAVFHHRRDQLHLIGVAQLNGGRQLIGLKDTIGTRNFLLDLDAEAIYVLAEFSQSLTALDDVLDPRQTDAGQTSSVQHLPQQVEREQQAPRQAG